MTDGLSEANREPAYSVDPMFGTCNACGNKVCTYDCVREQLDVERLRVNALCGAWMLVDDAMEEVNPAGSDAYRQARVIATREFSRSPRVKYVDG